MHEWLFFHAAFWFSAPLYTAFRFKKRKYMRAVFPTGEICVARALPIIIIIFSLFSLFFFTFGLGIASTRTRHLSRHRRSVSIP
jgi:uncharacterized membrane protein YesL